jgi:serine/threonine-protein kinase
VEALPGAPLEALPEVLAEPPADSLPEPPAPVETAVAGVAPFAPEATVAQVPLAELLAATNLSGGPEPGGSSQISSVSIIRPPSLRAPRPGLRWGLLGAAALLLLGVGLWFRSSGAEQKKVAPEVASPVDAVASGSAEPAPTAVDPPSEPVPPPVVSAEPSAGVSSEPPPPSSVKPAVKVPPTPRKNNCNPPYTLDKKGIKRIKPECA